MPVTIFPESEVADIETVDNVAALKALVVAGVPDGQMITTRGYYTDGDGGQGTYIYDAGSVAADNGGTVIAPTVGAGRYLLQVAGVINVLQFGCKGDGAFDNSTQINNAAAAAKTFRATLFFPAPSVSYLCNSQIDLRDIENVWMDTGAVGGIASSVVGSAAVLIGGNSQNLGYANLSLFVHRPSFAIDWTSGTVGIQCSWAYSCDFDILARGFESNLLLNPDSGKQVTYNRIKVRAITRGKRNIYFAPTGTGYCNQNQVYGGVLYLENNGAAKPEANILIHTEGTSQVADLMCREIDFAGASGPFPDAALVFRFIPNGSTVGTLGARAFNCRAEVANGVDVPVVIIDDTANDRICEAIINLVNNDGSILRPVVSDIFKKHYILVYNDQYETGSVKRPIINVSQDNVICHQSPAGTLRVYNRQIFRLSTGQTVSSYFMSQVSLPGGSVAAWGDSGIIVGSFYTKRTGDTTFISIPDGIDVGVVCFDASGNVLSGSSPLYCMGRNMRTQTTGSTSFYQCLGGWLWLHQNVARVFIGYNPWNTSPSNYRDVNPVVAFGADMERVFDGVNTGSGIVSSGVPQSFFSAGQIVGDVSGTTRYQNSLDFQNALAVAANAGDTTVTLTSASGLANGDVIGVQLDATIFGQKRYHMTTINGAPVGNVVTLTDSMPSASAIGNIVKANRWTTF